MFFIVLKKPEQRLLHLGIGASSDLLWRAWLARSTSMRIETINKDGINMKKNLILCIQKPKVGFSPTEENNALIQDAHENLAWSTY